MSGAIEGAFVLRIERGPDVGVLIAVRHGAVIGRQGDRSSITDPSVSRQHLRLEVVRGSLRCLPVGESPTFVGDGPVVGDTEVPPGSVLRLGMHTEARVLFVGRARETAQRSVIHATANGTPIARLEFDTECVIGREPGPNGLALTDGRISRVHAIVRAGADGVTVEDVGSSNGTFVSGRRIPAGEAHAVSGPIRIGDLDVTVDGPAAEAATEREITVRSGDGTERALRISAGAHATVADVTAALELGLHLGGEHVLWRTSDGLVPHPSWTWTSVQVQRGERWVLDIARTTGPRSLDELARAAEPVTRRPASRPYTRAVNRPPRSVESPGGVELNPPPLPNEQSWRAQGGLHSC